MFGFTDMMGTYEQRKVANTVINGVTVDTCSVTDSTKPFETAIEGSMYNNNKWVIVEEYATREEAQKGHDNWVKKFSDLKNFPQTLEDVSSCEIKQFINALTGESKTIIKKVVNQGKMKTVKTGKATAKKTVKKAVKRKSKK